MTKEEIIDNIARLNSETWRDREEVRAEIGKLLAELRQALEQPSDDCVSRAELKKWLDTNFSFGGALRKLEMFDRIDKELPSVTPAHCIAAVRFSKEDLREICNERIEIECTHGTCKDCHNAVKNYGNGRIYCLFSNCIYDEDFYCKEFNRRGNENG